MMRFDQVFRHRTQDVEVQQEGATLRVIEVPARWTPAFVEAAEAETAFAEMSFQAEVVAKRFGVFGMETDRFSAVLTAEDVSPATMLAALADACARTPDLRAADARDERIVLQITLSAVR